MHFPSYIPEIIKKHATNYLEGEDADADDACACACACAGAGDWCGWIKCLKKGKEELSKIEKQLKAFISKPPYDEDQANKLSIKKSYIESSNQKMERDIARINRLISEDLMKKVYERLNDVFFVDVDKESKILIFIHSAWSTNIDYEKPREAVKKAEQLYKKIEAAAEKLADLLDEVDKTGCYNPSDFFRISYLLGNTDSRHNFDIWRLKRSVLMGKFSFIKQEQLEGNLKIKRNLKIRLMKSFYGILCFDEEDISRTCLVKCKGPIPIDPIEACKNDLQYVWGIAPDLSELLRTVKVAASKSKPNSWDFANAAIESRQNNFKAQYLRGFINLLCQGDECFKNLLCKKNESFSTSLINAIADTATIVLNEPDLIVSYDDVIKKLE